jgi:hypothetical protein
MGRTQKHWDFIFAVALIGGMPLGVLIIAGFGLHLAMPSELMTAQRLRTVGPVLASVASFIIACWWRTRHRKIRSSLILLEVGAGLFFGFAFLVILLLAGYAAYRAD